MISTLNKFLYFAVYLLLFAYVYVKFSSRGAFGEEDLYGYGRILGASNIVMLSFLALNIRLLRQVPSLVLLVILWLFWMLVTCAGLSEYGFGVAFFGLLEVSYCPLLFLAFYVALKQRPDRFNRTNVVFVFLLTFCAALFLMVFRFQNMQLVRQAASLNDVYFLLLLLPWVLLFPKVLLKYAGILLIVVAVLWSMKRTALIVLVVALVGYFLAERSRLQKAFDWRWVMGVSVLIIISFQLFLYIDILADDYITTRLSGAFYDRGSGRLDIYNEVIRLQGNSTIDDWIIGHGHNTVRKYNTLQGSDFLSAHNDWLEVLFDYGLPAFVLIRPLLRVAFIINSFCSAFAQKTVIHGSPDGCLLCIVFCDVSVESPGPLSVLFWLFNGFVGLRLCNKRK
jgi:hypothetical protein